MKNQSHLRIFLECVIGKRHFSELYTKKTRDNFPHRDYKWVYKTRIQAKEEGYAEVKEGNNFITITKKGAKYLKSLEN